MDQSAINLLSEAFTNDLKDTAEELRSGNSVLCHYTSAENALNILKTEKFWLRNASCMNDYSEVTNGVELVASVLKNNRNSLLNRLLTILRQPEATTLPTFVQRWDNWIVDQSSQVFIGCLSKCRSDDKVGKLSMWRAYGSNAGGVCFLFNSTPFLTETDKLGVYSMPVSYYDHDQFYSLVENAISTLEKDSSTLERADSGELLESILSLLVYRSVSLKHPGFVEEQEFRLIHIAGIPTSEHVTQEIENIGGIPQIVQKISLRDDPENGLHGADLKSLIRRVIIGPSNYPEAVESALIQRLTDLGVEDAADKVVYSGIPLRLN